jgi:hypothetical protein
MRSSLHNILEQVDLESADFTQEQDGFKILHLIEPNSTKCILKAVMLLGGYDVKYS